MNNPNFLLKSPHGIYLETSAPDIEVAMDIAQMEGMMGEFWRDKW